MKDSRLSHFLGYITSVYFWVSSCFLGKRLSNKTCKDRCGPTAGMESNIQAKSDYVDVFAITAGPA